MDGILDFAVCIWSWLLVLGTRPMGREIAYKKIRKMESMGRPKEQIYCGQSAGVR